MIHMNCKDLMPCVEERPTFYSGNWVVLCFNTISLPLNKQVRELSSYKNGFSPRINSSHHTLVALNFNELVIAVLQEVHPYKALMPHLHAFILNSSQQRQVLMWPNVTPDIA